MLLFFIVLLLAYSIHFKNIYSHTLEAKASLEDSVELIKIRNFSAAKEKSSLAYDDFNESLEALASVQESFIFSNIQTSRNVLSDFSSVLTAGRNLSRAAQAISEIGVKTEMLLEGNTERSFESLDSESKKDLLKVIYESSPEFYGIKANIDLSVDSLGMINPNGVFYPIRDQFIDLRLKLIDFSELMDKILPILDMLPQLAGYPEEANYLLILQNQDELRPSGGFIGTYGILQMRAGEIERLDTHDIYHLDMPVKDRVSIVPPDPLKKYLGVDKWYMRDSNWYPDWSESAQKIESFYKLENSKLDKPDEVEDFVGVIGITPSFVTDLLAFTGPLEVNGEIYNKDNFVDLLQYKVEKGYVLLGVPSWHRKEEVGDILSKLKKEILGMSVDSFPEIVNIIDKNLAKKDIQFYFKDLAIQEIAKNGNYSGEIYENTGDYLMVVDANMAAYKTDAVMGKSIEYSLNHGVNGLFSKLQINYIHRGSFDWKTTRYRSYTRVYVPKGSELIRTEGVSDGEVLVREEGDKTVFEAFISVEPGKIGNLIFEYKLPEKIAKDIITKKEYRLYTQKQAGSEIEGLNIKLNFDSIIKSYTPTGFFVDNKAGNGISWEADLNSDREFTINF